MTAAQIKNLRTKLNLSQASFAKKLGVARRTVQWWEAQNNRYSPSPMALEKMNALGAPESPSLSVKAARAAIKQLARYVAEEGPP